MERLCRITWTRMLVPKLSKSSSPMSESSTGWYGGRMNVYDFLRWYVIKRVVLSKIAIILLDRGMLCTKLSFKLSL